MSINIEEIYSLIQEFETDKGGDNAEKGFSFQFACLLLDILKRFKHNKDFMVCGETVDDYVIVDDAGINVCQCKNFKDKSYTITALKTKVREKSMWDKISSIYKKLAVLVGDAAKINSWILINKTNKISLIVEKENKKAYNMQKYENNLNLGLITKEEKTQLNENGNLVISDFDNFTIYKVLGYDTYDSEVKNVLEEIINDKYSEDVKYNPVALYKTLVSKIRERSVKKKATNLKMFTEDIERILRFNVERFYDFVNVKDQIATSYDYDIAKVNSNYNCLQCILNPLKSNMVEMEDFLKIKELNNMGKSFDEIIEFCRLNHCLIKYTTIDEIIALILLCRGEKI